MGWSAGDDVAVQIYRIYYAESDIHHRKQTLLGWATE